MTDQYNDMGERDECGRCKFWLRRTDYAGPRGGGYCVRFPPIFKEDAMNDGWPNVHQQSWCGEFKLSTPQPNVDEGDGK